MKPKSRIPEFVAVLDRMHAIQIKKNKDYANESNPFSNFERIAEIVSWFHNRRDRGFAALVSVKIARLAELSDGREPSNESVVDTFVDLANYCALWAAYRMRFPYGQTKSSWTRTKRSKMERSTARPIRYPTRKKRS